MLAVWFNFLHYQVVIHHDTACPLPVAAPRAGPRQLRLTIETVSEGLTALLDDDYPFSMQLGEQSLWLMIDCDGDQDFERALQRFCHRLIARRYPRFRHVAATSHC